MLKHQKVIKIIDILLKILAAAKLSVSPTLSHFRSSLIFVDKAISLPLKWGSVWASTREFLPLPEILD
jgi:hypothetical protein